MVYSAQVGLVTVHNSQLVKIWLSIMCSANTQVSNDHIRPMMLDQSSG